MITSTPASTIGTTTATFASKSSSAGATFACRLALVGSPPPAFTACPIPVTYVQLSAGTWKFDVRSTSTHGLTDPTPSTYQFTIDTTPPTAAAPAAPTIPVGGQLQLDGTLGVQESWSASDTYSPSSALLYTVEQRAGATPAGLGSFAAIPTLEDMQGTTAAVVPIAPGGPYHQLRVRAENQLRHADDHRRRRAEAAKAAREPLLFPIARAVRAGRRSRHQLLAPDPVANRGLQPQRIKRHGTTPAGGKR